MKERIKTAILILLVINSVILSGLLIFHSPSSGNVSLSEYLPRVKFGDNKEIQELVTPKQFTFHYGENQHTVATFNSDTYEQLKLEMKDWIFYESFTNKEAIDWRDLLENEEGLEIIFPSELPMSILSNVVGVGAQNVSETIDRIWLYQGNEDYIQAYFISDNKDTVWNVKTSISNQKLTRYLNLNKDAPKYKSYIPVEIEKDKKVVQAFYIPIEPIEMKVYQIPYQVITVDDMIKVLFVDPNMVRKVYETENRNSMLYTDGSRSMEVFSFEDYISYYQPSTLNQKAYSVKRDVQAAIRFVNQHGGWDGSYLLDKTESLQTRNTTLVNFRFYLDGNPVIMSQDNEGQMVIQVTNGTTSSYQRPMLMFNPRKIEAIQTVKMLNETSVIQFLEQKGLQLTEIRSIEFYYQLEKHKQQVILIPYMRMKTIDGKILESPVDEGGL